MTEKVYEVLFAVWSMTLSESGGMVRTLGLRVAATTVTAV